MQKQQHWFLESVLMTFRSQALDSLSCFEIRAYEPLDKVIFSHSIINNSLAFVDNDFEYVLLGGYI